MNVNPRRGPSERSSFHTSLAALPENSSVPSSCPTVSIVAPKLSISARYAARSRGSKPSTVAAASR